MAVTDYTQTVRRSPAIEAAQENYIDLLTQQVGRAPGSVGVPTLAELGPQVAGQNVLTQAAQQQAATQAGLGQLQFDATGAVIGTGTGTGVAGYQPFLDQAAAYSGPTAYQAFMSPYQQQVLDTTLAEFDVAPPKPLAAFILKAPMPELPPRLKEGLFKIITYLQILFPSHKLVSLLKELVIKDQQNLHGGGKTAKVHCPWCI